MRNSTIDLFKFIACVCVISLHIGLYVELPEIVGTTIRQLGRWAVPFFFLVTGVFLGIKQRESSRTQIIKLLRVFIVSCAIFLPYLILKQQDWSNLSFLLKLAMSGSYFHLWFLTSMMLGLALFDLIRKRVPQLLIPLSILFIAIYTIVDIAAYTGESKWFGMAHAIARHFTSFSFITFGYLFIIKDLRQHVSLGPKFAGLSLVLFSLFMLEPHVTQSLFGSEALLRQFPVFTPAIAVLILAFCLTYEVKDSILTESGQFYSLGIYILHPLFTPIFLKALNMVGVESTPLVLFLNLFTSWIVLIILRHRFPALFGILNGSRWSLKSASP